MTSHHPPPSGSHATDGWSTHAAGPPRSGTPAAGAAGSTRPLSGIAVAAILILVASAYVAVLGSMPGRGLTLSFTRIDNVFFVWFTSATTGAALVGIAAASIRSRRLGSAAIALLGLHCLALVIILVVQLVITARLQYVVLSLTALLAVGLGLVAAVTGTIRARQAHDPAPVGLVAGGVGVLISTLSGPLALLVSGHPGPVSPLLLQVLIVPGAIILIEYGARRSATPLLIITVAALVLLVLLQIPQAVNLARFEPILVLGPVLRSVVVIVGILAVVMLVLTSRDPGSSYEGASHPHHQVRPHPQAGAGVPHHPTPPPQPGPGAAPDPRQG